ncbi:hypothetical protein ACWCYK_31160 [Streptomyces lydicamycinicus]
MPTFGTLPRSPPTSSTSPPAQSRRFHHVVRESFVPGLRTGLFRPGLRIKGLRAGSVARSRRRRRRAAVDAHLVQPQLAMWLRNGNGGMPVPPGG